MNSPKFSIIIPTYNRADTIQRAIQGVLDQTFSDWELIIIDDGSTDNTKMIVSSFSDERIQYYFQKNQERSAARNHGINLAQGEWICFLDSDDAYKPNHLQTFQKFLDSNSDYTGMLISRIARISNGESMSHPKLDETHDIFKEILSKFILMNTVCVHHSILKENQFDLRFRIWEDTHLWMRIAAQFPIRQLNDETCVQYIQSEGTVSAGLKNVQLRDVKQYINAITDLETVHKTLFENKVTPIVWTNYKDEKYAMYLYQARQNRQLNVALQTWALRMQNKFSFQHFLDIPKIVFNKFGLFLAK